MKRLVNYFLKGLIFLAPIAITVWLFVATFRTIDSWLGLPIPGVGVAIVLVVTTLLGFLLSNFLTRGLLSMFEGVLDRLPFVRLLHTSMKDLMTAFVGDKRKQGTAVMVDLGNGIRAVGFITRESLAHLGIEPELVAVYFPQSYNFAGQVVLVPRSRLIPMDEAAGKDVMAFIVSGGLAGHS